MIVAIDGPAGAGKSTVAKALARRLGCSYLDTGAMYRCVALAALRRWGDAASDPRRSEALGPLAESLRIELGAAAGDLVLLDGEDVTGQIRTREVSEMASVVAAVSGVRVALVSKQRQLIASGSWVAEGRDVGTAIAPDAELKVFLTADPSERARRRATELGADVGTVLAEQAIRDSRDSEREHSPLEAAGDAVNLDTTGLSVDEVVETIATMVAC